MFSHTVFVPEARQSPRCREGWGMAVAREVEPFAHASRMLSTGRGGRGEGPGAGALLAARSIGHGTFRRQGQGQSLGVAAPAAPPRAPRQRAETPPTEARAFLKPRRTPMVPARLNQKTTA